MPTYAYTTLRELGAATYGVWHVPGQRYIAAGLPRKAALAMRDRLNDQARRATSVAPPGHGR